MKNALIVNGGQNSTVRDQLQSYDFIIAVDSGAEHVYKLFLKPDLIVGDLDSIEEKTLERAKKDKIEILELEENKDQTDFEIALNYIINKKCENITIIGGEYGDIDHLFGTLFSIANLQNNEKIMWIHGNQKILFPNSSSIDIGTNTKFSILHFTDLVGLEISGAQWNLDKEDIKFGFSRLLRNKSRNQNVNISVQEGKFCLVIDS